MPTRKRVRVLEVESLPKRAKLSRHHDEDGNPIASTSGQALMRDNYNDNGSPIASSSRQAIIRNNIVPLPAMRMPVNVSFVVVKKIHVSESLFFLQSSPIIQSGSGACDKHNDAKFTVTMEQNYFYQKFKTQGVHFDVAVEPPSKKAVPEVWLLNLLNKLLEYFKANSKIVISPGDRIGITLINRVSGNGTDVYISLRRMDQMDASVILDHLTKILDSNQEFFMDGNLSIQFHHIQMPHGTGRGNRFGKTADEFIKDIPSFIKYSVGMKDNYCLPYALVVTMAWARKESGEISYSDYKKFKRCKLMKIEGDKLCRRAGVDMDRMTNGCSLDEVKLFQRALPDYRIVIYETNSRKPVYADIRYAGKPSLNIMLHDNHYTGMRNVQACLGAHYICPDCFTHSNSKLTHRCIYACTQCQTTPKCDKDTPKVTCSACRRYFYGMTCYLNHLNKTTKGLSVCDTLKNCDICQNPLTKGHKCGLRYCVVCEKQVSSVSHFCHMPKYESKRKNNNYLYVFYDLETQQNTLLNHPKEIRYRHVPNLCVTQNVCSKCINIEDKTRDCRTCGVREHIYYGEDCIARMMDYIVEMKSKKITIEGKVVAMFKQIIVIAHNNSSFDGQFVLRYLFDSDQFQGIEVIMNGTKIIECTIGTSIKFIDSLIYFQRGLASLPNMFGFEGSKGHYPFLFNHSDNDNYVGTLPEKKFYGYDSMMPETRESFDKWYNSIEQGWGMCSITKKN